MDTFVVSGRFKATDIDDALNFLSRHFAIWQDDPVEGAARHDRAVVIEVKREDVLPTGRAESS